MQEVPPQLSLLLLLLLITFTNVLTQQDQAQRCTTNLRSSGHKPLARNSGNKRLVSTAHAQQQVTYIEYSSLFHSHATDGDLRTRPWTHTPTTGQWTKPERGGARPSAANVPCTKLAAARSKAPCSFHNFGRLLKVWK